MSLFEHIAFAPCQIRAQATSTSPIPASWLATILPVDAGPPMAAVFKQKCFTVVGVTRCESTIQRLPDS